VGAEICLRKVKCDYLAGRGASFSQGRPADAAQELKSQLALERAALQRQHVDTSDV